MARARKPYSLTEADRDSLNDLLYKGKHSARKLNRARMLLRLAAGLGAEQVAQELGVSPATVHNIRNKYLSGGLATALEERPRPGRPTVFDGEQQVQLTVLACSEAPGGRAKWTLRLLAEKAVELKLVEDISHDTVRRILKKTT